MYPQLFLLLVVVSALVVAAPMADGDEEEGFMFELGLGMGECKCELKISNGDLASLIKGAAPKDNTKCFMKCSAEKMGLFKGGKLVEKEALEWIEMDRKANATLGNSEMLVFNACKNTSGKDECDTANKMFTCARDAAKKYGLLD